MVVRLRLSRPPGHTRKTTHFNLVAIDIRKRRDAKPIEIVGVYDPVPRPVRRQVPLGSPPIEEKPDEVRTEKMIEWSVERVRYWLGVGAQPSKTVGRLLEKANIIPPQPPKKPTNPPEESSPPSSGGVSSPDS